jgi:hypothetical protein
VLRYAGYFIFIQVKDEKTMDVKATRGKNALIRSSRRRKRFAFAVESLEQRLQLAAASFASPVTSQIITGAFPVVATATGDLNGDGIPDLIADRADGTAQVFLGTATGAFTPSLIYPAGGQVVALADFNGDGNLDLATASGVLPGAGDGTFGTVIAGFTLPPDTVNLYAEPLTTSGNFDLIAATFTPGTGTGPGANPVVGMSVLLGNGNGTFQAARTQTVGSAAAITSNFASFTFASFTSSGNLDVLTPFGVMLGKGDGTFANAIPLPYKSPGTATPVLPSEPVFAVGAFTTSGNTDIVTVPVAANTGEIEIFLGNGNGTFSDNGTVLVGAGDVITALDADVLTTSGNVDLIAGIEASGTTTQGADIAVLTNGGSAAFAAPTLFPTAGPANNITAADFNADGNLDLLAIEQPPGTVLTTALEDSVAAEVLLSSTSTTPVAAPVLTVGRAKGSPNPAADGDTVTYVAVVQPPANSASGAATATGTVTFHANIPGQAVQTLGSAQLVNGKAALATTVVGIGDESITFTYSGGNYASATSPAISETVLRTMAKVPFVTLGINVVKFPAQFLNLDTGILSVTLTNAGGAAAHGIVGINVFLSPSGAIDSSAIQLDIPELLHQSVNIGSGKSLSFLVAFSGAGMSTIAPGNYFIVAQATAVQQLLPNDVDSTTAVSAMTYSAGGLVFGDFALHQHLKLRVTNSAGQVAIMSIYGPGTGTVTQSGGATDVTVSGTNVDSVITIASSRPFILNDLTINGVINGIVAYRTTLAGNLTISGGAKQVALGPVGQAADPPATITIGGTRPVSFSLGIVDNAMLQSAAPINTLAALSWQGGSIDATSIASLAIRRDFSADVQVHSKGALQSARLGSISGGDWAVAGGIGSLNVTGNLSNATIYAGTDAGADDMLGTSDDIYSAASIGLIRVGGSVDKTQIAAGPTPISGQPITSRLTLLPNGRIGSIVVRGTISDDSQFLAAHLPENASLDGIPRVATANNSHFTIVPLLQLTFGAITLPSKFLTGDPETIVLTVTNSGGMNVNGVANFEVDLSTDGAIDSNSYQLVSQNESIKLDSGKSEQFTLNFTAATTPPFPPGTYFLAAQATAVTGMGLTSDEFSPQPTVSASTHQAEGTVFGDVGIHRGLSATITHAGQTATLSISGRGFGTVTQSDGMIDVGITGANSASRVTIAGTGPFTVNDVTINGPLGSFVASNTTLVGKLTVNGSIGRLALASAVADAAGAGIDALSIQSLQISGDFATNVSIHGGSIQAVQLGSINGALSITGFSTWAVAGGIGTLRVAGGLADANIYAGADAGADDILGTGDDTYSAASIGTIDVGGNVASCQIVAGPDFVDGASFILLPGSRIGRITIGGTISPNSPQFFAVQLPLFAKVGNMEVSTAGNPDFSSNGTS